MMTMPADALFQQLYDLLLEIDTPEAEEALGYLAQAQAAWHGENAEGETQ